MRFLSPRLTLAVSTLVAAVLVLPASAGAVEINDPKPEPFTNVTTATFSLTADPAFPTMSCTLNAGAPQDCTSGAISYPMLADGLYTLSVTATGPGGADPMPSEHDWTVDTIAPTTSITAQPPASSTSATATFQFTSNEVGTFQCSLDGAAATACTSPQNYTVGNGSHTFSVFAVDQATNADATPVTATWSVTAAPPPGDTTPPDTTITSGPGGANNIAQPSVVFTSSEAGSTFQCSVNGGAFVACSSPNILGALVDGAITFEVRAVDAAGNVDPTPAALSWTRDTTPPASPTVATGPRSGPFQTTTELRARWAAVQGAASYDSESRVTSAGASPNAGKWQEVQTDGTDRQVDALVDSGATACFRVRATDAVGNDSAFGSRCTSVAVRPSSRSVTRKSGYLRLRLNAGRAAVVKRVALVATKCPRCGSARVVVTGDGTPPIASSAASKTVSLRASRTQRTRVIAIKTFPSATASLARRYVYVFASRSTLTRIEGIGVSPV